MSKLGLRILQSVALTALRIVSFVVYILLVVTSVVTAIHDRIRFGK